MSDHQYFCFNECSNLELKIVTNYESFLNVINTSIGFIQNEPSLKNKNKLGS